MVVVGGGGGGGGGGGVLVECVFVFIVCFVLVCIFFSFYLISTELVYTERAPRRQQFHMAPAMCNNKIALSCRPVQHFGGLSTGEEEDKKGHWKPRNL